jgi:hypothetical protein
MGYMMICLKSSLYVYNNMYMLFGVEATILGEQLQTFVFNYGEMKFNELEEFFKVNA